jgi:dipeptidase E
MNSSVRQRVRIVAAGKGRSMCLAPIVDSVLKLVPMAAQQDEIRLVYIGTASYDKHEAFEAQTYAYAQLPNCRIIKLDVSEACDGNNNNNNNHAVLPSVDEIRHTIRTAHIIMASGGNTLYAVTRWKELQMDQMILEAVTRNDPPPVLCGGSAGSIVWFQYGHSDSMDPTTFLHVDPNLTDEEKRNWDYIR